MKPPILYPGGKMNMAKTILNQIPWHSQYVEPFCGGASIFWHKPLSDHTVLNDTFSGILNFYRVIQDTEKRYELIDMIKKSLYHETLYKQCREILINGGTDIEEAYSVFIRSRLSFGATLTGGFGAENSGSSVRAFNNASKNLIENIDKYADKLKNCEILSRDAVDVIKLKDTPDTFFYVDPPYIGAFSFHYAEYTEEDYERLLDTLSGIKGKFMLSSYETDILKDYIRANGWIQKTYEKPLGVTGNSGKGRRKIESVTMNYSDATLDLIE